MRPIVLLFLEMVRVSFPGPAFFGSSSKRSHLRLELKSSPRPLPHTFSGNGKGDGCWKQEGGASGGTF